MSTIKVATMRPTLKTLAREAGVSLTTASQVIRGTGRISSTTRNRVFQVADAIGYLPDDKAVAVRTGRSFEVGIIVQNLTNHFNAELINGVTDTLEKQGLFLSIQDARDDQIRLEKQIRLLLSRTRAGLLWVPTEHTHPELLRLIASQNVPNITFLRTTHNNSIANLSIANSQATQQATAYLWSLGHRHIAFAGGIGKNQTRLSRICGYQRALKHKMIDLIFDAEDTKHGGFHFASQIQNIPTHITAVVCNSDEFAIGLCLGLQRLGKQPGCDISIIGFDDIDETLLLTPPLTTIAIMPYQFGQQLANMLLDSIQNPHNPPQQVQIQPQLVIRQTTAPPPKFV